MMRPGDYANAFVLVNSAAFFAAVLVRRDLFAASFVRDGFCVTAPNTWRSSHALCFYVDTLGAAALCLLARRFAGTRFVEPVAKAGPAVFAHGAAHLGLALGVTGGGGGAEASVAARAATLPPLWIFYFALLRSAPRVPEAHAAAHAALHSVVLGFCVPPVFSFTYVQTSLLWVAAAYDLARDDKDRCYDLFAVLVAAPVGVVSWFEGLACDAFYKSVGGHVWYDGVIPASMLAYLWLASKEKPA